jgi:N-acetyl-gamma-glutamyl-phosphate/LysW-gamma-L-alpha-aminoadipyl-6-phosphate reductase
MKVAIVGGSGFVGGELLRLLLRHPEAEVVQVTSDSMAGKPLSRAHPNLRKVSPLLFTPHASLAAADATFVATPHGESMDRLPEIVSSGGLVFDLSADFRLRDPEQYPRYYGRTHPRPDLLPTAVYGLPEVHREALRTAAIVAVPGCIATASILALRPLVRAGMVGPAPVVVDAKSGSSASGRDSGPAGLHAERSGVMRAYAPAGHRHTAEIEQETGVAVALSCHGVEAVRGSSPPSTPSRPDRSTRRSSGGPTGRPTGANRSFASSTNRRAPSGNPNRRSLRGPTSATSASRSTRTPSGWSRSPRSTTS